MEAGVRGGASGIEVREAAVLRGVKRVRMEVSVAGAADDMEVRLVVLAILKCERVWVLARVESRVRKRAVQAPKKLAKVVALTEGAQEGVQGRVAKLVAVLGNATKQCLRAKAGVGVESLMPPNTTSSS